jgi:hypothetical protein
MLARDCHPGVDDLETNVRQLECAAEFGRGRADKVPARAPAESIDPRCRPREPAFVASDNQNACDKSRRRG